MTNAKTAPRRGDRALPFRHFEASSFELRHFSAYHVAPAAVEKHLKVSGEISKLLRA